MEFFEPAIIPFSFNHDNATPVSSPKKPPDRGYLLKGVSVSFSCKNFTDSNRILKFSNFVKGKKAQ